MVNFSYYFLVFKKERSSVYFWFQFESQYFVEKQMLIVPLVMQHNAIVSFYFFIKELLVIADLFSEEKLESNKQSNSTLFWNIQTLTTLNINKQHSFFRTIIADGNYIVEIMKNKVLDLIQSYRFYTQNSQNYQTCNFVKCQNSVFFFNWYFWFYSRFILLECGTYIGIFDVRSNKICLINTDQTVLVSKIESVQNLSQIEQVLQRNWIFIVFVCPLAANINSYYIHIQQKITEHNFIIKQVTLQIWDFLLTIYFLSNFFFYQCFQIQLEINKLKIQRFSAILPWIGMF
eukprot:TRINITY_DN6534_c0_g1_i4.p1 TRINITY_DN6534_c0_g1~~TRINITY_DN6534_c0_g1_i4.p1  ORF type:complete len:289 (-),score=-11.47 TRINITY_DN6534_c0_g1_i4:552-1418(-)